MSKLGASTMPAGNHSSAVPDKPRIAGEAVEAHTGV